MLSLFPGEQIVVQSNNKSVVLTSHRIAYEVREWGKAYNQSIMLEHITSCENYSSQNMTLLILSIVCLCIGLIGFRGRGEVGAIAIVISIASFLLYRNGRRNFIIIGSPSTKMKIPVQGLKRDQVIQFLDKVERAKNERIVLLNKQANVSI